MAEGKKQEIITFKVDGMLREALERLPNRSEFIRSAVLMALENSCPLCNGTGCLTAEQRRHWDRFAKYHRIAKCNDCHATHLVCSAEKESQE